MQSGNAYVTALFHKVGNGIDEAAELASHMCRLATDGGLRHRIGQAGYECGRMFSGPHSRMSSRVGVVVFVVCGFDPRLGI